MHTVTIPAAQLAVDRINNDSRILKDYYLQLLTGFDTKVGIPPDWESNSWIYASSLVYSSLSSHYIPQCNGDDAIDAYFRFWTSASSNQTAPFFFGGGCTPATVPMAAAARFWRTMQVAARTLTDATHNVFFQSSPLPSSPPSPSTPCLHILARSGGLCVLGTLSQWPYAFPLPSKSSSLRD